MFRFSTAFKLFLGCVLFGTVFGSEWPQFLKNEATLLSRNNLDRKSRNSDNQVDDNSSIFILNSNKNQTEGDFFDHFTEVKEELAVPIQLPARQEFYALPPSKNEEGRLCPQCVKLIPEIFKKVYCSSKLAVRVKFKGHYLMTIIQDLTPNKMFAKLHQLVAFTMKGQCICDKLAPGFEAILLVTPPRTFNVRSVQVLHLDDSYAILPWETFSSAFESTLNCSKVLLETSNK